MNAGLYPNNNEDYTMIIHHNKVQYRKNQQIKHNFRHNITLDNMEEGIMINFPYNNVYYSYKCPTVNIPLSRYFKRSGVIPYTYIDNVKYFCLAVDSRYGNLTDFGGGVKKNETFAGGAARELEEESLGVFKLSSETLYNCSTAVYDKNTIIMFIQIQPVDFDECLSIYFNRLSSSVESETRGIFWIPEDRFYELIKSGRNMDFEGFQYSSVYRVVADLLRSVSNINEILNI